jgi:Cu(I)/Ag(I) efflux system membrane fusion protein
MNRPLAWILAALAATGTAAGAWWLGMHQGMAMMAAPEALSAAAADPSQWTIPQGEAATRRHIRDQLKAGDVDPVTGLRILNYHDPMVPGRNFDAPAKSPFMDMMLVPRYAGGGGAAADEGGVTVSPRTQQNLGLRTAPVETGTLAATVQAVGTVAWNERTQVLLQARATGFVERLHVRAALDRVAAGAPVAELYVPAWVAAQEEYLALQRMQGPDLAPLRDAARQRMRLAGMDEALIARVVETGVLQPRQRLLAPIDGVVTELMLREGATVMAGETLLRIQGTATVWAEGAVPESQAARLRPGAAVLATSPALPGTRLQGRVQALLPQIDPATRTRAARLELPNPGGRLVPGMTVQMDFPAEASPPMLLVPSDAVIHTGRRAVVMLAEAEGRFRPVEVTPGREADGRTEIVAGLQPGQRVVLSGQFLIDSEASLRGLAVRLNRGEPETAGVEPDPTAAVHAPPATV